MTCQKTFGKYKGFAASRRIEDAKSCLFRGKADWDMRANSNAGRWSAENTDVAMPHDILPSETSAFFAIDPRNITVAHLICR
jgi:hypothetical protein